MLFLLLRLGGSSSQYAPVGPSGPRWRDRDRALSLAVNGRQDRRFRPSFTAGLEAAGAVTYVHSLIDPAAIRRFWDLGIGVYSD